MIILKSLFFGSVVQQLPLLGAGAFVFIFIRLFLKFSMKFLKHPTLLVTFLQLSIPLVLYILEDNFLKQLFINVSLLQEQEK